MAADGGISAGTDEVHCISVRGWGNRVERVDEIVIIRRSKATAPRAIRLSSRDGKPRQKIGIAVGGTLAILQGVVARGEKLKPT